jgi:hypothetical protein
MEGGWSSQGWSLLSGLGSLCRVLGGYTISRIGWTWMTQNPARGFS